VRELTSERPNSYPAVRSDSPGSGRDMLMACQIVERILGFSLSDSEDEGFLRPVWDRPWKVRSFADVVNA